MIRLVKTTYLLFTGLLISTLSATAQDVESRTYSIMLSGLLSRNVPEADVSEIAKDTSNLVFLDAREKSEFEVSHIKNAVWIGYDDFNLSRVEDIPKDAQVVVYCSVGYRSEKVTKKLQEAGFTSVRNLYGGLFEWINQDNIIVGPSNANTTKVHAFDKFWGVWLQKGEKVYD
jgi:rhodanese-related sulfurtransferase